MPYNVSFYQYSIPYKNPSLNIVVGNRRGLFIEFQDSINKDDLPIWVECSPFPYKDNCQTILITQIKDLLQFYISYLKVNNFCLSEVLANLSLYSNTANYYRESLYAVESFILAYSYKYNTNLEIPKRSKVMVELNALLDTSIDSLKMEVLYLLDQGYECFKVKIKNSQSLNTAYIELIKQLRSIIGHDRKIRLDANQGFTLSEAISFFKDMARYDIEYVEEPLISPVANMVSPFTKPNSHSINPHLENLEYFHKKTGVYYALDESTRNYQNIFGDIHCRGLQALILKVSRLGFWRTMQLKKAAIKSNIQVTLSCPFETELAYYSTLGFLADENAIVGYDTFRWVDSRPLFHKTLNNHSAIITIDIDDWLYNPSLIQKDLLTLVEDTTIHF